ncbi:MAG: hypothetical protein AYP45_03110 [Candidatus Brocadia carolinensis]|uniref:LamG-like jellyroll fold domain-containing protein n=1 Tax=Candidatus Brocadia carolinensis TaxID=1004156 RepID=A0A1V4AWJ2_9BACT|nr:MAG: hypothetical protein AYP45_03110 [Candidatus Brocadia caroliniensis]
MTQVLIVCEKSSADNNWKNFYGVGWKGTPADNIKYANQMGHKYIAIQQYYNKNNYVGNAKCAGLKFYVLDPHFWAIDALGFYSVIDTKKFYTQSEKDFYNKNMAWKSNDSFPNNMATGWFYKDSIGNPTKFNAMWDLQQQAVIDMLVEKIIEIFHSYEDTSLPFTFAGYILDKTELTGDFQYWNNGANKQATLAYWTGSDSSVMHSGITHNYSTYTEAMVAYLKKLNTRMKQEFPNAKWILGPWSLYYERNNDEWVNQIKNRYDKDQLTPDMLTQEAPGTSFVDDGMIFNSGVNITKDMVGISQIQKNEEYENRLYAAKAGINGAWYNWLSRFGNSPNFDSITLVYPRLKLVRCIPNWDNLNSIPLASRSWDGSVYRSTKSYISSDVMYSRHPKTGKLFAVFNTTNGVIKLNTGESVTSVKRTDGYFIETVDGSADFTISGNEIRLKSTVAIPVDSSNGQVKGNGYIITLAGTSSSATPDGSFSINGGAAYTKATGVTLNLSATDDIGVTGYYLSTSSAIPSATAAGWTSIAATASYSANVPYTLSSGNGSKTIYVWYKDAAGNVSDTVSDTIILDTTVPTITITSPTSNATYSTTSSTISLGGNASDATSGVSVTTWSSSRGGNGTASGTTSWSIANIALSSGSNIITVTVTDKAGNNDTDTITVTYSGSGGTTTPEGSFSINGDAAYTKATGVTLNLSATDDIGVTGYYLSTSSAIPSATAAGWTSIAATASYSANVPYTLSSGNGSKTIYVWYKDAAGNVSDTVSDTIILDTIVPTISITSPTSNATYSTTSSTISLGGNASDATSGVSVITWSSNRGGSGTASGTTSWSIASIALSSGSNIITVTVTDKAGNNDTDTITVTYSNSNNLQAYYALDTGAGSTATDSSGNNRSGTIYGAAWSTGKNGNGLRFDGTNEYVSIPRMNYDEISISAWFYKNAKDTSNADAIFGGWRWDSNTQLQEGYDLRFHQYLPDRLEFVLVTHDGDGVKTRKYTGYNFDNSIGAWYHVAGTYNKTTGEQRLYIDGQLVDTQTHPAGNVIVPLTSYSDMRIGHSRVNDGYFNGIIDEVRIYSQALSDQMVLELSANTLAGHWKFDEGSGTVANDSSGNNRNGTVNGAAWSTGKNGDGLRFDGTNDYVSIPRMNYDEISISAWFYKNAKDTSNADAIFGGWRWESNTQLQEGYDLRFHQDTPDMLDFILITQDAGGDKTDKVARYRLGNSVGTWYHVAGTYNKTTGEQKLYIDGQLVDTQTHPAGNVIVPLTSYSDMRIGHSRVNDGYFNGIIDEVRIYNQALSDQTVLELSANTLAGHWKFDEGSGTVANDSSGNDRKGTIVGADWSTGKTGKGLRFNGTADYVSIPSMNYDEISISAWFYKKRERHIKCRCYFWRLALGIQYAASGGL